jgi:hypothetical protein
MSEMLGDHPLWCAVGGAVVGAAVVFVLGLTGALPSSPRPSVAAPPSTSPAAAFLAAWRAHLMTSWSVDEVDERTTTAGATVRFQVHEAQDPPNSVLVGNGTVAARQGPVELACGPAGGSRPYACRSAAAPLTWPQQVDRDVAGLRAEVEGPGAYFAVRATGPGCWAFDLVKPPQAVPVALGRGATYCLDLATGALRSSEVQRVGAVDRLTVNAAHAPATAADLALPAGARA